MKTSCVFWLAGVLALFGQSGEEQVSGDVGDPTEVRAVSVFAPEEFVPPTPRVKESTIDFTVLQEKEHRSGGRVIRVSRVANPNLPEPPPPSRAPGETSLSEEQLQALRDAMPEFRTLMVGATVYDSKLTHFRWWHEGESFEGWSTVDFFYFASLVEFVSHDVHYNILLFPSRINTGAAHPFTGERIEVPEHPELPAGEVAFVVTEGDEDNAEAIKGIMALHEVYAAEMDRLHDAYLKRQRYSEEFLAWRKANPPKPRNVNVSFWVRKSGQSKEEKSK